MGVSARDASRREVEKILAHGDDPTGILKTGAIAPKRSPSAPSASAELPAEIAGYRIVRPNPLRGARLARAVCARVVEKLQRDMDKCNLTFLTYLYYFI